MRASRFLVLGGFLVALVASCVSEPVAPDSGSAGEALLPVASVLERRSVDFDVDPNAEPGVSVYIRYDQASAPSARVANMMDRGARFASDFPEISTIAAVYPEERIEELRRLSWVVEVRRGDDTGRTASAEAPPIVDAMARSQLLPWGVDHINADLVHQSGNRGGGVTVAMLDSGVECGHPDLQDRLGQGYDYLTGTWTSCIASPHFHGTAVAGVFAASDNATGVVGVAPEVTLHSFRVCDLAGGCYESYMFHALWSAWGNFDAQVINVSIGNCGANASPEMQWMINSLWQSGVVIVWSAGNGLFTPCLPGWQPSGWARLPETIAVSAVEYATLDTAAQYSYGPGVDFAAPHDVRSDSLGGTVGNGGRRGTSYAAPHVAGTVALMLATGAYAGMAGSNIPIAIKNKLIATADDRGPIGKDNYWGYGIVDAWAAVQPSPPTATIPPPYNVPPWGFCQWNAGATGGIPPYSYQWWKNGVLVGTSSSYFFEVDSGNFFLELKVTDAAQAFDWDQRSIVVQQGSSGCPV